jgi:heptosyltransferase-2
MNPSSAICQLPPAPRILVRGTNWLGDAVMTTPALLRLREKFPQAHIALLTPDKLRDLWANHPAVNETISLSAGENVLAVGKKLRAGNFDLALVLPNSPRSAIETWLAGIPQRIGYARPWRTFFLTQTVPPRAGVVKMRKRSVAEIRKLVVADGSQRPNLVGGVLPNSATAHQIHEYLHLAAELGANPEPLGPQLVVTAEEVEFVKSEFNLDGRTHHSPFFGLNAGAEYGPAKRWPMDKFITAAIEIQRRTNCTWILLGSHADRTLAEKIEQGINANVCNMAGQTSLRELMAVLKLCRVLLTNDSGPMHVAAALGTPVVVPFGSTSPELTGPGMPGDPRHRLLKSDAPCSPCFLRECPIDFRCMNGIGVERVVEAVLESKL